MHAFGSFVAPLAFAFFSSSAVFAEGDQPPLVAFENDETLKTKEGHVALRWSGDRESLVFELQYSDSPQFSEPVSLYHGVDSASFQSGLTDGEHFYRVRARAADGGTWGPWSEPVEVQCTHHSLPFAWTLFASGSVLFLLIVLFVGVHARSPKRLKEKNG